MKNYIKNIAFLVLFLITSLSRSQIQKPQYNNLEQRTAIFTAMTEYLQHIGNNRITVAAMQVPNTNDFIIASSSSISEVYRNTNYIKSLLYDVGFADPWLYNGAYHDMRIYFVSGSTGIGIGFVDYDGNYFIKLPSREGAYVHAEMAILAALQPYYTDQSKTYATEIANYKNHYVIQSQREFCPRCYGYLNINGFPVPTLNTVWVQGDNFSSTTRWSPPNFNGNTLSSKNIQGNWDAVIRGWTLNYVTSFPTVQSGDGNYIHTMGHEPCPVNHGTDPLY
ncbi:hypothetical protein [Flavivirga jejuensis]|uniref:Uncharacterized protein n=1 Tax=Flavivirga jejuensis TaxID=870487 RepID=A0ABT8WV09_9FLAO|nr:hypothetical protein [Flavivirga jejuensis]MDO5976995.1 hypothetical protein [Flavivirga jejuensis]